MGSRKAFEEWAPDQLKLSVQIGVEPQQTDRSWTVCYFHSQGNNVTRCVHQHQPYHAYGEKIRRVKLRALKIRKQKALDSKTKINLGINPNAGTVDFPPCTGDHDKFSGSSPFLQCKAMWWTFLSRCERKRGTPDSTVLSGNLFYFSLGLYVASSIYYISLRWLQPLRGYYPPFTGLSSSSQY